MQKTINSNIGGRIFHVEEDAYALLESYLRDVKNHFSSYADSAEIMIDIENRIAEQFENIKPKGDAIISKTDVDAVIAAMGQPQDFSDSAEQPDQKTAERTKRKRLYRNTDDQIIAGVASGIAAYFDIDPLWVRLLFVISIFLGGYGILLYVVLWITIPAAESASEKVEMKGNKVTLASLEQSVKEKIIDNEKTQAGVKKAGGVIRNVGNGLGKVIRAIIQVVVRVAGAAITVGTTIASFFLVVATIMVARGSDSRYVDFPARDFFGHGELFTVLFSGFFAIIIPLLILLMIGVTMVSFKNIFNKPITISLIIVWFVAGAVLISTLGAAAPRFEEFRNNHPAFKRETREIDAKDFTKISVERGVRVEMVQKPEFSVKISATQVDQDRLAVEVKDGVLSITEREESKHGKICIFCFANRPTIFITAPAITAINGKDAVSILATGLQVESFTIKIDNASRADITYNGKKVVAEANNASKITFRGSTETLDARTNNASRINGYDLQSIDANASADNASRIQLRVTGKLQSGAFNGSRITYTGEPKEVIGSARREYEPDDYQDYEPLPVK